MGLSQRTGLTALMILGGIGVAGCPVKKPAKPAAQNKPAAAAAASPAPDDKAIAEWQGKVRAARELNQAGRKEEAEKAFEEVRRDANTLDLKRPEVIEGLREAGFFYHFAGKSPEAEQIFTYVLALQEQNLGPDHPLLTRDIQNLANVVTHIGDWTRGEELFNRAIRLHESVLASLYKDKAQCMAYAGRKQETEFFTSKSQIVLMDPPTTGTQQTAELPQAAPPAESAAEAPEAAKSEEAAPAAEAAAPVEAVIIPATGE